MDKQYTATFMGFTIKPFSLTAGLLVVTYAIGACLLISVLLGERGSYFGAALFPGIVVGGLMNEAGINLRDRPFIGLTVISTASAALIAASLLIINLLGLGQP